MEPNGVGMNGADIDAATAPAPWPLRSHLTLIALPNAPYWARRLTADQFRQWGLAALVETAELLISELLTNAVKASGVRSPVRAAPEVPASPYERRAARREPSRPAFVGVRLSSDRSAARVEVWDTDPRPPVPRALDAGGLPPLSAEEGRGLFLVETLARSWGWYYPLATMTAGGIGGQRPHCRRGLYGPPGKVVWCEMAAG